MKFFLSLALTIVAPEQANAQCAFTFCGGLVNMPDQTFDINQIGADDDGLPSTPFTCAEVFAAAATPGSYTATECEQSVKLMENVCCPAQATPRQCFLCGDSQAAFNTDKTFLGFSSCGSIDQGLSILPSGDLCHQAKNSAPFSLASYCGCAGATAPNKCKFCPDGQVVNATAPVPGLELIEFTCGDAADIASHVTNDTACAEVAGPNVTAACCIDSSGGISLSISSIAANLIVGLAVAMI